MNKNVEEIIKVGNNIFKKGLVSGKSGNISKRIKSANGDIIAITPTLKSLADLQQEDIVLVDLDGNTLTSGKPSSEINMHLEIYKKRPDINAIVHTHSPYATGFSFSNKKIRRLEGFGEIKDQYLPEIDYAKPGTDDLKKHGVICVGENIKEAESLAIFIEESAKTQFISLMLNSVEDKI